ncbi:MAG: hypothetical protein H7138_05380 [Myxococcales bacterium]|nr:hypothetical protein [Myxococcales bacterium]
MDLTLMILRLTMRSGLPAGPALSRTSSRVVRVMGVSMLMLAACAASPGEQGETGETVGNAQSTKLPLEVLGPVGTKVTLPFTLRATGTSPRLRFECHSCGFNDVALDGKGELAKAQLFVNDRSAVALNRYTGKVLPGGAREVVGNAQLVLSPTAEAYGGIGGGFRTVRIELPVDGLHAGANRITFEYAREAPGSLGFRITSFDVIDTDGSTLLQDTIAHDDPGTWTPDPTQDAGMGAVLWARRDSLYDPVVDDLDDQRGGGTTTGAIHAACADCHAADGHDLKFFNYSTAAIVARAKYHRLSAIEGKQIAAYIRGLGGPVAAKARPWNPPYQPGPELDLRPAREWAAGAGIEAVLETDAEMEKILFPAGVTRPKVAAVVNRFATLNMRELSIALQLPDWNQWLPKIHPLDAFDTTADVINRDERGAPVGAPYFEHAYERARDAPTVANITALRESLERWLGNGADCYTQQIHSGPAWRAVDADVLGQITLPPAHQKVVTAAECAPLRNDVGRIERIETAKNGLVAFISVKQWELMHAHDLEEESQTAGRTIDIPHGGSTTVDASEARGWTVDGFSVFMRAPHYVSYNSEHFTYQDELVGTYETSAWYHLQLVLNPGYRRHPSDQYDPPMPYHIPYTILFMDNLASRSGLADGFRFWATYIKLRQQQTNGFYGVENGLDLRTAQPFYLYSDEFADTRLRAAVGKDLWGKLADALLSDLVEDASLGLIHSRGHLPRGGYCVQDGNQARQRAGPAGQAPAVHG